jgi:PAS domain S-box-containing protein
MRLRALLIIMSLAISMIPVAIIGGIQGFEIATAFLGLILVVTFFVSLVISYFISLPLVKLTKSIDEISKGNLDINIEKSEIFEIDKLTESLNRVMASLKLAIHKVGVKKGEIFEETIKAKEEAEAKFENLIKSMDDWVWEINDKGICSYCSDNVVKTLGYKPNEIIGKKVVDLISSEEMKNVKNTFNVMTKDKKNQSRKFKTQLKHKTGKNISVFASFITKYDDLGHFNGFMGIVKDNTELKVAEEKIIELNKRLNKTKDKTDEKVIKKSPKNISYKKPATDTSEAIFFFDEKANIIDCNEIIYNKLGYNKDEMLSLNLSDLDYLETKDEIKNKINKIKKLGNTQFKTIHKKKNGSSLLVNEEIQYIKDKNLFKCVIRED